MDFDKLSTRQLKKIRKFHRKIRKLETSKILRAAIHNLIVKKQLKFYVEQANAFGNLINRPTRNERRAMQNVR